MNETSLFDAFAAGALAFTSHVPWWLDFLKTFVAALLGAGLAFFGNQFALRLQLRTQREMSANLAIFQLSVLLMDCVNIRTKIADERARVMETLPHPTLAEILPNWFFLRMPNNAIAPGAEFNFEALSFVFSRAVDPTGSLFGHMHISSQRHKMLFMTIDAYGERRQKADVLVEAAKDPGTDKLYLPESEASD